MFQFNIETNSIKDSRKNEKNSNFFCQGLIYLFQDFDTHRNRNSNNDSIIEASVCKNLYVTFIIVIP